MTISLDGLLDYNEDDRDEGTFELNLFAETLKELFTAVAARRLEVPTRSLYSCGGNAFISLALPFLLPSACSASRPLCRSSY
jgi:hypothetical protein